MSSFKPLANWDDVEVLAESVNAGKLTATELVERSLGAIEQADDYNALITICGDSARQQAKAIDEQVGAGKSAGKLAGVPFIAKDNYLTSGIETTAASNILKGYIPPYSATVIERLEAEGAILVGKANLDAFAHGSSTENSDFGPSKNPYDTSRVPGGSSGGSAVAVALGLVPFSLGSDTGGSIRLPASFCGIVGFKPTYGLVSRYGVIAMASSTDCMGPLTRSVTDAAYVLDVMAGRDPHDSTTIERAASYRLSSQSVKGKRIGVVAEFMGEGLDSGVKTQVEASIDKLRQAGAKVETTSIPLSKLALACYYVIVPAEISSNLSRYDGIRYGLSKRGGGNLDSVYKTTRSEGFNAENKRRIMTGTFVLSSGYYDAYYQKAMTVRTKLIEEFSAVASKFDLLLGPTAPTTAFKLGANAADPLAMYLSDVMTVTANLVGNPAISIPVGLSEGLPVGLQLMAGQQRDQDLLELAQAASEVINA